MDANKLESNIYQLALERPRANDQVKHNKFFYLEMVLVVLIS